MSKIGRKPIVIPQNCSFVLKEGEVDISGPVGGINLETPKGLKVEVRQNSVWVERMGDEKKLKMLHGCFRQILANAIQGVVEGWSKELEVKGTGFKVNLEGKDLILNLGFSHPVKFSPPQGLNFEVKENKIKIKGVDRAKVGLVAEKIRRVYPPDPYKGKGIRYLGEQITLKPGKAAKIGPAMAGGIK